MKKKDLKSGMIVEYRNGDKRLVLTDCEAMCYGKQDFCLIGGNGINVSDSYNEDLTDIDNDTRLDIVKVYNNCVNTSTYSMKNLTLLWERSIETITIGDVIYDKSEFEEAVKNLKPLNKKK